jgi:hypoxanthine phosphoribosyltransferase
VTASSGDGPSQFPAYPPPEDLGEILFTEAEVAARVTELGQQICRDFAGETPLLVGVLKGSAIFVADLARAVPGPVELDFLAVSSYGEATKSSGVVKILKDLDQDIAGRPLVLVEDIIDSGLTMQFLVEHLSAKQPSVLKTCSLLVRQHGPGSVVPVDYVGFRIPPAFVIGYGLDVAQRYRNLPYIATFNQPG